MARHAFAVVSFGMHASPSGRCLHGRACAPPMSALRVHGLALTAAIIARWECAVLRKTSSGKSVGRRGWAKACGAAALRKLSGKEAQAAAEWRPSVTGSSPACRLSGARAARERRLDYVSLFFLRCSIRRHLRHRLHPQSHRSFC